MRPIGTCFQNIIRLDPQKVLRGSKIIRYLLFYSLRGEAFSPKLPIVICLQTYFIENRNAHVKTPLRGAWEGCLRTNMPFFLRHMILKRDFSFDSFRYMLSNHNFCRHSQIFTRRKNSMIFIIFTLFWYFHFPPSYR